MRLVSAVLARNEAGPDRFLRTALARCLAFSDTVVVLDDHSQDATPQIAEEMGCVVESRTTLDHAWGHEGPARRELWELACRYATGPNDWILVCDADQVLVGDVRALCRSRDVNCWAFVLYDLWSENEYREDNFWQAHQNPRPWLYAPHRVPEGWVPQWNDAGLHPGHAPLNYPMDMAVAPTDTYHWLHYSYSTPALREKKHAQYMAQAHLLSPHQKAHADSILA